LQEYWDGLQHETVTTFPMTGRMMIWCLEFFFDKDYGCYLAMVTLHNGRALVGLSQTVQPSEEQRKTKNRRDPRTVLRTEA